MITIAIIGAGQLGSRHLQALAGLRCKAKVYVVDPDQESLSRAQQRFEEVGGGKNVTAEFCTALSKSEDALDFVIVATNSNVRRKVVEELLTRCSVRYLILEKVLFQKLEDYIAIRELLAEKRVKTWVNCPSRIWGGNVMLKEKLSSRKILEVHVSGSNWGLGCNAIHIIDLISFFTDKLKYSISAVGLDSAVIPSKRPGFIEFTGALHGVFADGPRFAIHSHRDGSLPIVTEILCEDLRCIIREAENKCWLSTSDEDWGWVELPYETALQSKLTNLVVEQLLKKDACGLTSYDDSVALHLPLISELIDHMRREGINGGDAGVCPIT